MNKKPSQRDQQFQISPNAALKVAAYFRSPQYCRHNCRRQEHLATLGLELDSKSVLELGAGVGDHTTFFLDRGCTVTSVKPRIENYRLFRKDSMNSLAEPDTKGLRAIDLFFAQLNRWKRWSMELMTSSIAMACCTT